MLDFSITLAESTCAKSIFKVILYVHGVVNVEQNCRMQEFQCFTPLIFPNVSLFLRIIILYGLGPDLRNLGYCPTMYMMLEATMALLSFPLFSSQRPSSSYSHTNTHTHHIL